MEDGWIDGNRTTNGTPTKAYGGVMVTGTFTMKGGYIKGNSGNGNGGGVNISGTGTPKFEMTGGFIAGNTAMSRGAAVYKMGKDVGTFIKGTNAIIYGNSNTTEGLANKGTVDASGTIHSIEVNTGTSVLYFDADADAGVELKHVSSTDKTGNWSTP
jgi:hypothetical protein